MEDTLGGAESSGKEWEIVKELVFQWETDQPADLDAWLGEHCPTASVRCEVERLARAAATSGEFMRGGAAQEHLGIATPHPSHIGRYSVIEELGAGGTGVVYGAYDQALERKVAIKVLSDGAAAGAQDRKRLRWDAKAASATIHPNIVTIYDIGTDAGFDYIVMECVEGRPLGKLIAPGGLPVQTALGYAIQIACALDAAHRGGIVHRDLKPNNIMIANGGVVKILDFGLAKLDNPSAGYTSLPATIEGHFAGTVAYVSPEQAEGKPVDNRGDIFSFGCILYEMLTGSQAFQGDNPFSVIGRILHQSAPRLRLLAPQLDERLETIVQRCLRKEPGERFAGMDEVTARLEELVETGTPQSRFSYRTRKRFMGWGIAAAAAALLTAGAMRMASRQALPKETRYEQIRITNDAGLTSFPAISADGQLIAYASDRASVGNLDLWVQHWNLSDAKRIAFNAADEYSPAFNPSGSELVYRSDQDGGGLYEISALGGESVLVAPGGRDGHFSPDGEWLAYWKGEVGNALFRGSARTFVTPAYGFQALGKTQEFPPGFDVAAYPIWSPAGNSILFLGRKTGEKKGDWWIAKLADKSVHRTGILDKLLLLGVNAYRTYYPVPGVWLKDNTVLFTATALDATNIWSVRIDPKGNVLDEPRHWTSGTEVEQNPDAAITSKGSLHTVYSALTIANSIWRIPLTPAGKMGSDPELLNAMFHAGFPSLSLDGRVMAFSARRQLGDSIQLAKLDRAPVLPSTLRQAFNIRPVLSGDGSTVAWYAASNGYIMAVKGDAPEVICRGCGPPTHVNFDGTKVIFEAGGSSKVEELQVAGRGQPPRSLFHIQDRRQWMQASGRFSPDERWVAFTGWHEAENKRQILVVPITPDGTVAPDQVVEITTDDFSNREPVWSPDGRRIYFLSNHDGPDCVWAVNVDPVSKRPVGEEFAVAHFHNAGRLIRGPTPYYGSIGLSAARNFLVLTLTDTKGNIWSRGTLR
jgi:serine/threonine protein kinase